MRKIFGQDLALLMGLVPSVVLVGCQVHSARRPEIQVDPAAIVLFGRQAVGATVARPVVVRNTGRAVLRVTGVYLEGESLPEEDRVFELELPGGVPSADAPWSLQPGEVVEFRVWYTPQLRENPESDQDTDRLHIVSNDPEPARADYLLHVLSSNTGAMLAAVPAAVDFCLVDGRTGPVEVILSNQGTEPTFVESVSLSGGAEFGLALTADASDFTQDASPNTTLDVGGAFSVFVSCNPVGDATETGRAVLRARVCSGTNNEACVRADNLARLFAPAWANAGFEVTTTPLPLLPVRLTGRLSRSFGNSVTGFRWQIVDFPAGSLTAEWFNRGEMQDPDYKDAPSCPAEQNRAADPCFIPDVPGLYRFSLAVDDERPVCDLADPGRGCTGPEECCAFDCDQQVCAGCRPPGAECTANGQCCTGLCSEESVCALCASAGEPCQQNAECCGGVCHQNVCAGCLGGGSACDEAAPQACCTSTCTGSMCEPCRDDGELCDQPEQCCSHDCSGGICGGCAGGGQSCSGDEDCCSENCNAANQCQPCEDGVCFDHSWSCRLAGEACTHSSECCDRVCDPLFGTCVPGRCLAWRSPCGRDSECCSGYCHPGTQQCAGACRQEGGCMCASTNEAETVVRAFGQGLTVYLTWNGTGDLDLHLLSVVPDRLCDGSHEQCTTSADCAPGETCVEADWWKSYGDCYWANAHPDWGTPRAHNGVECNSSFDCLNDPQFSELYPDCINFGGTSYCTDTRDDPRLAKDENKQFGPEVIKLRQPEHVPGPPNIYRIGVHFFPAGLVTSGTRTATLQVFYLGQEIFADISPNIPLSRAGLRESQFWYVGYLVIDQGVITFHGADTVCGNQSVDAGEDCDDNNTSDWDGCRDCFAVEARVNTRVTQDQARPGSAISQDNRWVAVWQSANQDGNGQGVFAQFYNAQGVASGSEFRVNTTTIGDQQAPAVAMDSDGDFVVVWQGPDADTTGIFGQRYNGSGAPVPSEFPVNTTTAGVQATPAVAMAPGGSFVVAWRGPDADGTGIWAQRYDNSGAAQGGEIGVHSTTAGDQSAPAVSMDATGNLVVVWQGPDSDGNGVFARQFDSAGNPLSAEFQVNITESGDQDEPDVAVYLPDGSFVVVWRGPDSGGTGVFARVFGGNGNPLTQEVQVNGTTSGEQGAPTVGMVSSGYFVVAWHSFGQDLAGGGIYVRRFDPLGIPVTDEFAVNEYMNNDQLNPSIAVGQDGRFALVWQSHGQDSNGFGIYAQRYDSSDRPLGVRPW